MSWSAYLLGLPGGSVGEWSYTHNCNQMANEILHPDENTDLPVMHEVLFNKSFVSWWAMLDGLTGLQGRDMLTFVVKALEEDPEHFSSMNPSNKWGDYYSFVRTLSEMRDAVPKDYPTRWSVDG